MLYVDGNTRDVFKDNSDFEPTVLTAPFPFRLLLFHTG